MRDPVVETDPILEAIACKLSGINTVPPAEQKRMIARAVYAARDVATVRIVELEKQFEAANNGLKYWEGIKGENDKLRKQLAAVREAVIHYRESAEQFKSGVKHKNKMISELQSQLAAAQEQLRWHFEDPPMPAKYYWCAFEVGQGPCYFSASGIWHGKDVVAWRDLPEHPKNIRSS